MKAIRQALLRGKRRPRRAGAGSPTAYRGDGYEFVELREYVPGDDVRRIDWAATARTAQLQTRVVLEDVALTICALVDESASMRAGRQRSLLESAHEAAQAWYAAADGSDRAVYLEVEQPFVLTHAFDVAAAVLPRGSALLVVSDFWDLPQDDDQLVLLGLRYDCTALVARDPWYDGLPLRGFATIRDAETGRSARVFLGRREGRRYEQAVRDREAFLLERFAEANWRAGVFDETDGRAALMRVFGVT
ncbi:MAG TPA: DUF58 domain-containing protein [Candidatus Baltobacteraceae bacterium]|nr:DUF58 domain-containing protein [Candidatus Baltobacteraceae bacterium]